MNNSKIIVSALEQRSPLRREGKNWRTRCPYPDHEDRNPSFLLYSGGGGRCFSQCNRYWSPAELADLLELETHQPSRGLTLQELALAKSLPEDFLESWGVKNGVSGSGANRRPCVDIPYLNQDGEVISVRKRLSMHESPRFIWRRGDRTIPYGLARMAEIRKADRVILVEGESDPWTLWFHDIPALGLPGASTWRKDYAALLQGLTVYIWREPDQGGNALVRAVAADLPNLRIIEAPPSIKDPSELHLLNPDGFAETMEKLLKSARPVAEIQQEASDAEARACLETCLHLLNDPNLIRRLVKVVGKLGYAGDPRPAIITYLGLISRLLERPLNVAYISPSAAGKNAAVEATLPMFSPEAFYLLRASSPRALIYNDENFRHRTVILTEADSLPEDGPAASAVRSLMSDGEMAYEVVEKGSDGQFQVRKILKPGPTGLITTSTKPLGDQATTRTLTVSIPDSPDQTRLVLHAQADRVNQVAAPPDLNGWIALDRWLALAGERRVVIPFANLLADLVPVNAVRMRRDFRQLLSVIQALALLHQNLRDRDSQGRIIATSDDYAEARWLLEETFTSTVHEGLTPAVRETVEEVGRLSSGTNPVSESHLVDELGLAKSTIHDRVRRALRGGWLINRTTQRGMPAQLLPSTPLPDGCPLPTVEELLVCVDTSPNHPNRPNPKPQTAMDQLPARGSGGDPNRFGNGSDPGSAPHQTCPDRRFGWFGSFPEGTTHTDQPPGEDPTRFPWDEFLDTEGSDVSDVG